VLADRGPGLRAVRIVPMGQECRACAHPGGTAPQAVAGGTPLGWVDRGLGEPTPAEQSGHLGGIALGVLRFPPMHGLPSEGLAQDTGPGPLGHTGRRASTRGSATRRPRRGRPDTGPRLGETVREPLACCGGARVRHPDSGGSYTGSGHASRGPRTRGAAWWRSALRSPSLARVTCSQAPPTTGVCRGGGLNHYHGTGADGPHPTLRCGPWQLAANLAFGFNKRG
jgi:hypothetical protein